MGKKKRFSAFIRKAGFEYDFEDINSKIMYFTAVPVIITFIFLIVKSLVQKSFISDLLTFLGPAIVLEAFSLYFISWAVFFIYVDVKIYNRRKEIEQVFPDFLQLAAANINAGMPIDRALWFAIRPKFGILAKEMESVAKATMVGENLGKALIDFSNKYDSVMIKRALNLLLEGLDSGGEIGRLLIKVANNMRETEILKKEMASSVTTYVIFILFATLGAAPFLFGLTTELIVIMTSILSNINIGEGTSSFGGMGSMIGSGNTVSIIDYQIFAITSISLSCVFAAVIISVIQKGDAQESLKNIPVYVIIGISLYFIAFKAMNILLGGFFS